MVVGVGETLNGRYRPDRRVGRGGFAQVYRGTDLVLNRVVAIRVLNPELTDDPTFLARFREEARRVAALDHRHILAVHDYGQAADTASLALLYVAGGALADRLRAGPPRVARQGIAGPRLAPSGPGIPDGRIRADTDPYRDPHSRSPHGRVGVMLRR